MRFLTGRHVVAGTRLKPSKGTAQDLANLRREESDPPSRLWKGTSEKTITLADFERLRSAILRDLDDMFFEGRYQRAPPRERAVLHSIAALGGASATVRQLVSAATMNNSELQPMLANLVDKVLSTAHSAA